MTHTKLAVLTRSIVSPVLRQIPIMSNHVVHFAIHADDTERARQFYEQLFGWEFDPWGPPDFFLIRTGADAPIRGALQQRQEPLSGTGMRGFECTVGVPDVAVTAKSVDRLGGRVTLQPMRIEGVGLLIMFEDTEGNTVGAMQYDEGVA